MTGMLSPYRVLDLTDERGLLAGMILADLGADVIQVEPPGGSPARRLPPCVAGEAGDGSLLFQAYARNKRGVVVDVESEAGREQLRDLVRSADFLIESFAPGYLAKHGLDYASLAAVNPGLIMASVTPYGQTGPKADWPAVDLTVMAASNYQIGSGDEDRAPLRIAVPQAFLHAAGEAAVGCLMALHERRKSGRGQHVDVSAQVAASFCTLSSILATPWHDAPNTRMAGGMKLGPYPLRFTYPAKDGHVCISFFFGSAVGPATRRLMQWVYEAGFCDESLRDKDWIGLGALLMSGQEPFSEFVRAQDAVAAFTASRTKMDLFTEARQRGVLLAPVSTVEDLRNDPHLAAREYWQQAAPGDAHSYPGPFSKLSRTPIVYQRPAPRLGEHTATVLDERRPPLPPPPGTRRYPPLAGLKVLDLTWVMVGPSTIRVMADFGATVVKVESATRIDTARTILPFLDAQAGPERSSVYANYNAGKLGLTLNLAIPAARDLVKRLAVWADVVAEAFTPKVMRNWGLDYEILREINPRLIYLSTSVGGAYGPYSQFAGFGNLGAALAGFNQLVGWPDRPPAGPTGAYTDYVTPRFMLSSLLAALDHRERTGEGQYIDQSQSEASIHFLAPAVLDYECNGRVLRPDGNRSEYMAPHGVFRAAGDDRWVALAARDDRDWRALLTVLAGAGLPAEATSWDFTTRKGHEPAIEAAIEGWTVGRSAEAIQDALIAAGVPAHVVSNAADVAADPQLAHRGHFRPVAHAELGEVVVEDTRFHLSATPGLVERSGPVFGQDNTYVLRQILGLDDEAIAELAAAGALH
ncbi:MAG: CoA transferase [Dehalococcoidia bacterium]|nr:CoA transferase [Dehalococcoidia bacterium]